MMKVLSSRPIPESYWVEPGRLLAGEYPGRFDEEQTRKRLDVLIEAGLDVFIDLTRPNEIPPYERTLIDEAKMYNLEVRHHRFPIGDFGLPTPEQTKSILDTIDENLQAGTKSTCTVGVGSGGQVQLWAVTSSDKVRPRKRHWSNCRCGGEAFPKARFTRARLKPGSK